VDGNVVNLAVVSMPADPAPAADGVDPDVPGGVLVDHITVTPESAASEMLPRPAVAPCWW
jgi:hypothetical protein